MLVLLRQSVLKSVQINGQPCRQAIQVEKAFSKRMRPAEFESGKTPGPQGAP